jgi:hypothetical protein
MKIEHYHPKLNDYVKWNKPNGSVEGWVYFYDKDYITIEIDTKEKPDELVFFHKKTHVLVVCYSCHWKQLEYVTSRPAAVCEYANL